MIYQRNHSCNNRYPMGCPQNTLQLLSNLCWGRFPSISKIHLCSLRFLLLHPIINSPQSSYKITYFHEHPRCILILHSKPSPRQTRTTRNSPAHPLYTTIPRSQQQQGRHNRYKCNPPKHYLTELTFLIFFFQIILL